jgi:hypothetical protein
MASLAGKGNAGAYYPFILHTQAGMFGVTPDHTSVFIGTGGVPITPSATTSMYADLPNRQYWFVAANLIAPTAAVGSAAITAQVIRSDNLAAPTDRVLTAATSLKSDFVTAVGGGSNYNVPITATNQVRVLNPGDTLRVDVVAAGTVTTQPQAIICLELSVIR